MAAITDLTTAVAASDARAQPAESSEFIRDLGCDDDFQALANGDKLATTGDYENARLEFARAWNVLRSPNVLLKLADAEERSGHLENACTRYAEFLTVTDDDSAYMRGLATYHSHDPAAIDTMRTEASSHLAQLQAHVGVLHIASPPDARVTVDGIEVRHGSFFVSPGAHVVTASAGGKTQTVRVVSQAGSTTQLTLLGDSEKH